MFHISIYQIKINTITNIGSLNIGSAILTGNQASSVESGGDGGDGNGAGAGNSSNGAGGSGGGNGEGGYVGAGNTADHAAEEVHPSHPDVDAGSPSV
jgi:hypothetical protein